jgi:hypothetical protein
MMVGMSRHHRDLSPRLLLRRAVAIALLGLAGCAGTPPLSIPAPVAEGAVSDEVPVNWPAPPADLERRIAEEPFEVRAVASAGGGTTGAQKFTLFFPAHGDTIVFKWKPVPKGDADGWNNAPRKELAAYALQSWFLDPPDYVVPTIGLRCLPFETLRSHGLAAGRSIEGTSCTLGVLSVWLDEVTVPASVLEPSRFSSDPRYARSMGHFNLLTYLIEHEDGRGGNILVSKAPEDRRVFAVDNGIAFGALVHNWFVPNWNVIRVPAVPRNAIDRLRRIGRSEIDRLGVLAELRANADGILENVTPGPNRDPDHGSRVEPGWLQLGLTDSELEDVEERLEDLIELVDSGDLPVF